MPSPQAVLTSWYLTMGLPSHGSPASRPCNSFSIVSSRFWSSRCGCRAHDVVLLTSSLEICMGSQISMVIILIEDVLAFWHLLQERTCSLEHSSIWWSEPTISGGVRWQRVVEQDDHCRSQKSKRKMVCGEPFSDVSAMAWRPDLLLAVPRGPPLTSKCYPGDQDFNTWTTDGHSTFKF